MSDVLKTDINLDYDVNDSVEAFLPIYTWPKHADHLAKECNNVVVLDEKFQLLIELMKSTIKKHNAVGLSAPQVGVHMRALVVDLGEPRIVINPTVIHSDGEQVVNEGCLSVPGYYKDKVFPQMIHVHLLNEQGKEEVLKFEGLAAAVLQHEINHLDGITMVDSLTDEEKIEAEETVAQILEQNPELYMLD